MNSCDALLAANIGVDCDNPMVGGLEEIGVLINFSDIDFDASTRDETNKNLVTLALKSGKKGFSVYQHGNQPFNGTNTAFAANAYYNKFTKTVSFVVYDHSADTSNKIIDQLANGTFVAVIKSRYAGSDGKSKYEVYGFDGGLRMSEGSRDPYSDDTSGAWLVSMQETAPKSALFMWSGSLTQTEDAFKSLMNSAS